MMGVESELGCELGRKEGLGVMLPPSGGSMSGSGRTPRIPRTARTPRDRLKALAKRPSFARSSTSSSVNMINDRIQFELTVQEITGLTDIDSDVVVVQLPDQEAPFEMSINSVGTAYGEESVTFLRSPSVKHESDAKVRVCVPTAKGALKKIAKVRL